MTNIQNLTVAQLRKVVAIREEIEQLEAQLASIAGDGELAAAPKARRRKMSRAARAAIGAAQRARWAKVKGRGRKAARKEKVVAKKRKVSAATRTRLAAAAKARWARAKAAGQTTL
jgi:hypothetical protein